MATKPSLVLKVWPVRDVRGGTSAARSKLLKGVIRSRPHPRQKCAKIITELPLDEKAVRRTPLRRQAMVTSFACVEEAPKGFLPNSSGEVTA